MNVRSAITTRAHPPSGSRQDSYDLFGDDDEGAVVATGEAARWPVSPDRYQPWWKVWLTVPLILLVLDVGFGLYFWKIPKLTGTADDYSYQFLYDLHELETNPPAGTRVVAFGSSVASAFDPHQIHDLLARALPEQPIEVHRLLRPGMKPSDYRLLWQARLEAVDPDVLVVVFNLVDFLNPSFERDLKPGIRYVLPPWETLLARLEHIPALDERLEMLFASASNLYRYRKPIQSTLRDHAKLALSWWRGGGDKPYGIYADGFTEPRFGVNAAPEIEIYVDPAWIDQRGIARVRFEQDGRQVGGGEWREPGWYPVALDVTSGADDVVDGIVEGGWSPLASADEGEFDGRLLGVRLRGVPQGERLDQRRPPVRYPPVEPADIKPFLRMGERRGGEYERRWRELLEAPTDFGKRFRLYRDGKRERAERGFEPTAEFAELRDMVLEIARSGRRVVMINTPESPLLEEVLGSRFYADYLNFFSAIAREDSRISFRDLSVAATTENFNDWHHLNYIGQLAIGPTISRTLVPVVSAAHAERTQAG